MESSYHYYHLEKSKEKDSTAHTNSPKMKEMSSQKDLRKKEDDKKEEKKDEILEHLSSISLPLSAAPPLHPPPPKMP